MSTVPESICWEALIQLLISKSPDYTLEQKIKMIGMWKQAQARRMYLEQKSDCDDLLEHLRGYRLDTLRDRNC